MSMVIEREHSLAEDEARARIRALGEYFSNKHGMTVTWTGDDVATIRGRYMVVTVEGSVTVSPGKVRFEGKDPGMLWRGKAKEYLGHKLDKYLNPSTPVDELPTR